MDVTATPAVVTTAPSNRQVQREGYLLVRTRVYNHLQGSVREGRLVNVAVAIRDAVRQIAIGNCQLVLVYMDRRGLTGSHRQIVLDLNDNAVVVEHDLISVEVIGIESRRQIQAQDLVVILDAGMIQLIQQIEGEGAVAVVRQREDNTLVAAAGVRNALDHAAVHVVGHRIPVRGHRNARRRHNSARNRQIQCESDILVSAGNNQGLERGARESRFINIAIAVRNAVRQIAIGHRQLILIDVDRRRFARGQRHIVHHEDREGTDHRIAITVCRIEREVEL